MFVLYEPEYPARPVPAETVRNSWTQAGLEAARLPTPSGAYSAADVRRLVRDAVVAAGAAAKGTDRVLEVPDEAVALLEKLERFYLALYPEMKDAPYQKSFHYERLEWLGEY